MSKTRQVQASPERASSATPTGAAAAQHPAAGMSFSEGASVAADGGFASGAAAHSLQMKGSPVLQLHESDVGAAASSRAVQFLGSPLNGPQADGEPAPAHGDSGDQRRFSVEQYVEMWEAEQGRNVSPEEQKTLNRGCIGITAMNLSGGGNPLDAAEGTWANFDQAQQAMNEKNKVLDWWSNLPLIGGMFSKERYVLFAKLFWSNQSADYDDRFDPDEDAFLPDPETGEVDMSGYEYRAQSRMKQDEDGNDIRSSYINFDYGFWDEASQCFWHANHSQPGMKVYQSTKDKFAAGYIDFDRIIYCIAFAQNYDPALGASTHVGDG